MKIEIIQRGKRSAEKNMKFDSDLLSKLEAYQTLILHLYDWERESITYGHFIQPEKWLNLDEIQKRNIEIAKRPTGGGIVFHACDLAFSVFVPRNHPAFSLNTLENYAFVNNRVIEVVKRFLGQEALCLLPQEPLAHNVASKHFCMAKPTKYDVMLEGKKVAGAAQRRTRAGFCHQGSIFLSFLDEESQKNLLYPDSNIREAIVANTFPLLGAQVSRKAMIAGREKLQNLLIEIFQEWEN